ncbi:MAG: hypothetical protein ACHQ0J_15640, partial [Candidatus Dormibacterales bacterium]
FETIPWDTDTPLTLRVTYAAGWNLVGVPRWTFLRSGVDLNGAAVGAVGPIYGVQSGESGYLTQPPSMTPEPGMGYWVYFGTPTLVSLSASGPQSIDLPLPVDQFVMIGNPGESQAEVSGADVVYAYDATTGTYQQTTTLDPGQGAWAYSSSGATVALTSAAP